MGRSPSFLDMAAGLLNINYYVVEFVLKLSEVGLNLGTGSNRRDYPYNHAHPTKSIAPPSVTPPRL